MSVTLRNMGLSHKLERVMKIVSKADGSKVLRISRKELRGIIKKLAVQEQDFVHNGMAWLEQIRMFSDKIKGASKMRPEDKQVLFSEYSGLMRSMSAIIEAHPDVLGNVLESPRELVDYLRNIILFPSRPLERDYTEFFQRVNNGFVDKCKKLMQSIQPQPQQAQQGAQ